MPSPLLGYNTNVRHHGKLFHIQTEDSGVTHGHIFTHLFADGGRIIATKKSSYAQWIGTERYPAAVKKLMQAQHKAMFIALRDGLFDEDEVAGAKAFSAREITIEDETGSSGSIKAAATPAKGTSAADLDADALDRAAAAYLSKAPSFAGDATTPGEIPAPEPARPISASPARARLDPTPVATPVQAPRPARVPSPGAIPAQAPPAAAASATGASTGASTGARPPSGATPRISAGRYSETQPASSRARPPSIKPAPEQSLFGADILSEKSLDEVIMSYLAEDLDDKE